GHDTGGRTLGDYAKAECDLMADYTDHFQKLLHDFTANMRNQAALADTVAAFGDAQQDMLAKSDALGDPPNGEGVAGDAEAKALTKSAVQQFHDLASSIRVAETEADIRTGVSKVTDLAVRLGQQGAELKKKYPTPELEKARMAIPGCSELFGDSTAN
ncbi:MAG TPA: hypothetical protein VFW21_14245, partial [Mycobacterium sp.]|nr:hypothetical protein [Mycobacterium sp.]